MRCLYKKYQCNMHFRICRQSFALTNRNEQWDLQTHCLAKHKRVCAQPNWKYYKIKEKRVYLASKNMTSCEKGIFLDANDSGKFTWSIPHWQHRVVQVTAVFWIINGWMDGGGRVGWQGGAQGGKGGHQGVEEGTVLNWNVHSFQLLQIIQVLD